MNDTKRITEGALMTGVYLLLLLVIIFMPIWLGPVLLFTLPVPFIFYSYRHNWKSGALMFIAALLFTLLFGPVFSMFTLLAGVGGVFLGGALHNKQSSLEAWAAGSVGFSIGTAGIYLASQLLFGVNWGEQIRNSLNDALARTDNMLSNMLGGENTEEQLGAVEELVEFLPDIIPSILVMTGIVFAFVSQWLAYKVINRVEQKQFRFPPFKEFKLPTAVLWYYFFALILTYIPTEEEGMLYLGAINVFTLAGGLLVLQGFSFIFYYAEVKKWSKTIPAVIVVICLLLPQILLYLVRILGIIDIGFSLRERIQRKK
ncbi:YybS family protein [Halobacillus sp. K22]|uniref:YybS family protein n=1 Tax=Halobacillus sp. K22 TaxID=3457431 RepID=UPI003FCE3304